MGRRTNQTFVNIPHARFIEMLIYKAELVGIRVIVIEESYTSKASFLDRDPLPNSRRAASGVACLQRTTNETWLYWAADGTPINADVNGAYNIIRKAALRRSRKGSRGA
jgi:putative transposase